jgi:hypothetical protein
LQWFMGGQNMGSTHGVFCVLTRWNALTPSLRATPLPRAFMGGQNMGSTHGVFCVLTRWNALTPSLRATPLPRAGLRADRTYVPNVHLAHPDALHGAERVC